jgi:hypothetical protein
MKTQKTNGMKGVLALALAVSLVAMGCSAQWISVALADLPVLVQMALNIATFTEAAQGKVISVADEAAIQSISSEASKDLNLLQSLYNEYKASPSDAGLQKINAAIVAIQQNLPALLQAAHISDAALSQQVTAGVNLILTLMPQSSQLAASVNVHAQLARPVTVPTAAQLKKAWNETVCGEVGCVIK